VRSVGRERGLIYVNALRVSVGSIEIMVRFTITVILLIALALWNLPEFEKWGRHEDAESFSQAEQECKYPARKVVARGRGDTIVQSSCWPDR
jgi:hypothetical protein